MMLSPDRLSMYYRNNFYLIAVEKLMSLTDLDGMIPFERQIYIELLNEKNK